VPTLRHAPVGASTSVDVGFEYRENELDVSTFLGSESDDVNGLGLAAGIRSNPAENLELAARASLLTSDYENALSFDLSAPVFLTENFGVSIGYERLNFDDEGSSFELSQFQLGARYAF